MSAKNGAVDYLLIGVVGVLAVVATNSLAPRLRVAAPLLLVLLGIAISFLPWVGPVQIDPELVLAGLLPPLLYASAVGMPVMDFRRDLAAISAFSVVLVVISAVLIGLLMTWIVPGLPLSIGIALGAIVSPTDAVATSIVARVGVPARIVTVLEGESLLNDASALVLLRSAVAAIATSVSLWHVAGQFVFAVVVAVVIGFAVGRLHLLVRSRLSQTASSVAVSLVVPFVAYLPAEELGASGLVAAVTAGLVTGNGAARALRAEDRMNEHAVWRTLELLLESAVFLLMGLQLSRLVTDAQAEGSGVGAALWIGAVVAVAVVAIRTGFVATSLGLRTLLNRRTPRRRERVESWGRRLESGPVAAGRPGSSRTPPDEAETRGRAAPLRAAVTRRLADLDFLADQAFDTRDGVVLVWAGMRGAVTLAAAQSLPPGTTNRSLLILVAFVVAAGTLLIQGGTLSRVARRLGVAGEAFGNGSDQAPALRADLVEAAARRLDDPQLTRPDGSSYAIEVLRAARMVLDEQRRREPADAEDAESGLSATRRSDYRALRLELIDTERHELLRLRDLGTYASGTLEAALTQLDADQIAVQLRGSSR